MVGHPLGDLPHTGAVTTHLLPQLVFPCGGHVRTIKVYVSHIGQRVTLAILRWQGSVMIQAQVVAVVEHQTTHIGQDTVSITDIPVQAGDFMAIIADEDNSCPITYTDQTDTNYQGSHIDWVLIGTLTNISVGQTVDIDSSWTNEWRVFAVSVEVANLQNTTTISSEYLILFHLYIWVREFSNTYLVCKFFYPRR